LETNCEDKGERFGLPLCCISGVSGRPLKASNGQRREQALGSSPFLRFRRFWPSTAKHRTVSDESKRFGLLLSWISGDPGRPLNSSNGQRYGEDYIIKINLTFHALFFSFSKIKKKLKIKYFKKAFPIKFFDIEILAISPPQIIRKRSQIDT
jgi:hypothetical protein